ncbi:uncharacterized protein LOC135826107 [Sycon ciliatum]|uniref:uncharacterized protein LOC135826107 n=1 Tax=Sycon ciliatum TaxID=27933 RepID=UPI0031F69F38
MSNEKALSDLRAKLGKKYLDNVYVKLLQDARAPKLDVRDLYVNLTIVQQREVKKVSKTANSSHSEEALFLRLGNAKDRDERVALSDIFAPAKESSCASCPVHTVALVGPAGSGKTMAVTKKLPLQWIDGETLKNTLLVFIITVRSVHERLRGVAKDRVASTRAQSLEELLRSSARELDDDDIGTVMEFLRHNADWEKVLFVIDGIDEGCIMDSVLYRLITRDLEDISPYYLLLLTARPCPTIRWLWEVGDIDRYLSLRGFDQVSRADFFERYGSLHYGPDWSSMRRNLTVFLRKLDSLHVGRLTYLPFMATLCVHAMPRADPSSLPHCATQLLQLLVMALLKRDLRSGPGRSRQFSQFAHLRGPQQKAMQEMAAFAYRMTAERAMVVEDAGDDSPWSGLAADVSEEFESLLSCLTLTFDETGTEQSLTMRQFVHLTIQELLCAYHIVRQLQEEDGTTSFCECFSAVVRATNFGEQFTHLLVYVSGLAPPGQHALVLHTIMTLMYREDQELPSVLTRSKRTLMLFKMLSEAYQATTGLRQEHAVDIKEMSCSSWSAIATAIAMFASNWVQIPMERNYQESDASDAIVAIRLAHDQFTGVRHIFAGRCHSVTSTEVYETLLQCQRNCSTLTLRLTKEDEDRDGLRTLSSLVAGSRLLREVDMKSDSLHAFRMESLERVAAAFESTESLRTIRFQYALLEDTTLHRIMTAISSSNKLQKLSIGIISEKLWPTMCSLIKACSSITHLHVEILWRSSINVSAHSRRLCQALECNTSLKEFAILGSDQRRSNDTRPLANDLVSVFAAHPTIELFCLGCRFLNLRNDSLVEAMARLITRLASQEKSGKLPVKTLVIIRSGNIADEGIRRCLDLVQASPGVTLQVDSMLDGGMSDELPSLRDNFPFFLSTSSIWWRKDSHHPRYSSKGLDELATMLEPERTQKEHDASNEANAKTTAEHQEDDPWLHPYYLDHYRDRILCIDPELLRLSTQSQGLLDNSQYVDLRTVQSAGALVHNQRCLEYARTFTKVVDGAGATDGHDGPRSGRMEALSEPAESFQRLLRALEHMGYRALRVEMEERMFKLHPDTGVPTLQMDDANKPVDPWQHEGFDMRFHAWILSLPSGTLRAHSQAHGMLTLFMVASLVSLESRRGSLAHNDTYLIYIRPNGVQSFVKFLNVIQGNPLYRLRVKEMSCFLPVDLQEPFLEESDNG